MIHLIRTFENAYVAISHNMIIDYLLIGGWQLVESTNDNQFYTHTILPITKKRKHNPIIQISINPDHSMYKLLISEACNNLAKIENSSIELIIIEILTLELCKIQSQTNESNHE